MTNSQQWQRPKERKIFFNEVNNNYYQIVVTIIEN